MRSPDRARRRAGALRRYWEDTWPVALILIPGLLGTPGAGEGELGWSREPDLVAYALVVCAALTAGVLRRQPGVTFAGCGVAVVTYLAVGYPVGPILIAVPVAAGGVAVAWPLRRALLGNVGLGLAVQVAGAVRFGTDGPAAGDGMLLLEWLALAFAAVAVPTAIGAAVRIRRESEARVRTAQARHAVSEERLRMAQELHDSVGHGLAVIAMQAGVALHVLARNPDKVRESLEAIQATSRESLREMRVQLDVLRTPANNDAPRRPAPGLAEAGVLLDRIRAGGLGITAEFRAGDLPPEVDLVAYRILQESLTNVLRHAGTTVARVRAARVGDDLTLEVSDDGPAGGASTHRDAGGRIGSGIAGMRARAEALGGELEAGPAPGRGFVVRARLPLTGRPNPPDVSGSAA
ncbi:sensor histidine kinase [Micromonospora sp. NBC_01796]|uniref:sensor histidine kinase n=1 Tax=Micromonospora sp. NBC_01796 TaxID=2975987 RepID=UPI002DDABE2E|nr:sensor histidine kinase [Micromonospora sp. NBC_01796]WSA84792.1 sensor histidine kinase [Micromonospora sp. NBC_01796]